MAIFYCKGIGRVYEFKNKEFKVRPLLIPASGNYLYTKDAAANMEKSSVECTVNDDNPFTATVKLFFLNYYTF